MLKLAYLTNYHCQLAGSVDPPQKLFYRLHPVVGRGQGGLRGQSEVGHDQPHDPQLRIGAREKRHQKVRRRGSRSRSNFGDLDDAQKRVFKDEEENPAEFARFAPGVEAIVEPLQGQLEHDHVGRLRPLHGRGHRLGLLLRQHHQRMRKNRGNPHEHVVQKNHRGLRFNVADFGASQAKR